METRDCPGPGAPLRARIDDLGEIATAAARIGLRPAALSVVVVGGADDMPEEAVEAVRAALERLAPVDGIVVDGGTDTGVMRAAGRARLARTLVGVIAEGLVDSVRLEPHHTHVLLVPGTEWGDESPWLPRVARALGETSVAIVAGGGPITRRDVQHLTEAGIPVIALRGSGGVADDLAPAPLIHAAPLGDPDAVISLFSRWAGRSWCRPSGPPSPGSRTAPRPP